MFGGDGSNQAASYRNDLWYYNVTTNEWMWVNGSNTINNNGTYGAKGVPAANNRPKARCGAVAFLHKNTDLYLFGGINQNAGESYNDLWRFKIDTNCVKIYCNNLFPTANFNSTNSGCAPFTTTFNNTSINSTSWSWTFGDGNSSTAQHPTNTYQNSGTYTVTLIASDGVNKDTLIMTNYVTVYTNAVATFSASNDTLCTGDSVLFSNTSINSNASLWTFGDGGTSSQTNPSYAYSNPGNYTVTLIAKNINGCDDTLSIPIFVTGAQVSPGPTLTLNCITPSGTISATSQTPNVSYYWIGPGIISGDSTSSPIVNNIGTYTVIITDPITGCTNSTTVLVNNSSLSIANVSPDTTITLGSSATLTGYGGVNYNWYPSSGLNSTSTNSVIANPTITTTYCVIVTDTNGCIDTACVTVYVEPPCPTNENLEILPNAFSPNADGVNDDFCLQGWSACIEDFLIVIYDRWGEKVYESKDANFCWEGKYRGTVMEAQVFVYYIKATYSNIEKPIIRKGNISLIR